MLQGFKDFIMRGNVIELAVGVVIGAAFTAVVTAFSDAIINPLLAALGLSVRIGKTGWKRVIDARPYIAQNEWLHCLWHMSADVCLDLSLHCKNGFFKYMKPKEEVLLDFI